MFHFGSNIFLFCLSCESKKSNKQTTTTAKRGSPARACCHITYIVFYDVFSLKYKETKLKTVFQVLSAFLRHKCVAEEQDPLWWGQGQVRGDQHRQRGTERPRVALLRLEMREAQSHCSLLSTFFSVVWFQGLCLALPCHPADIKFPCKL